MSLQKSDAEREWRPPSLDSNGQVRFWNRMAATYESADMTHNDGEQAAVERLTDEYLACGHELEDVVTLGGAVGCRDPRIVMDRLQHAGKTPRRIIFNDLASALVAHATYNALAPYHASGIEVRTFWGKITEAFTHVPKMPRRVLIGVYSSEAFVRPLPEEGHHHDGLAEYLSNGAQVGSRLWLEWFRISSGVYTPTAEPRFLTGQTVGTRADIVRASLEQTLRSSAPQGVGALRVIGASDNEADGFFLSHWFTKHGITSLLNESFIGRAVKMRVYPCGKGMVICLDPLYERPRGILTVLNNVVGNILPNEQLQSLRMIHRLTF